MVKAAPRVVSRGYRESIKTLTLGGHLLISCAMLAVAARWHGGGPIRGHDSARGVSQKISR